MFPRLALEQGAADGGIFVGGAEQEPDVPSGEPGGGPG